MVKIDLISGFLGAGKTTFIKQYARFLAAKKEKVCILENDYGAINIDSLLLNDLKNDDIGVEMVVGGDAACFYRRFKTKLLTLSLLGYTRVIVEPSGIFDVDEFFDCLQEDELVERYEINNLITIVDLNIPKNISSTVSYLLASQIANAGMVLLSHYDKQNEDDINIFISFLNNALTNIKCSRKTLNINDVLACDINKLTNEQLDKINQSGYQLHSFEKNFSINNTHLKSLFFMNNSLSKEQLITTIILLFKVPEIGNIFRIKGFIKENDKWYVINATKNNTQVNEVANGQNVIIVLGEDLNEKMICHYFPSQYSTIKTS